MVHPVSKPWEIQIDAPIGVGCVVFSPYHNIEDDHTPGVFNDVYVML